MEKKTIEEQNIKKVVKRITCLKPSRDLQGQIEVKYCLQYLVKVVSQENPNFEFLLNLASYATSNCLSDKQKEKAIQFIEFYEKEGVL